MACMTDLRGPDVGGSGVGDPEAGDPDAGGWDFGGRVPYTTWDGEPISREPPHGATIVLASRAPEGWRYVLLHRAHHGPDYNGDWAWTPPSGSRKPGEALAACAARELEEETGLRATPQPVRTQDVGWAVFALEVPWGTQVTADGTEHDRLEWVTYDEARRRCRPDALLDSFVTGCEGAGLR
jgi:8-oxo-dGTP pyrophosphatase MutT (NUDIX family)